MRQNGLSPGIDTLISTALNLAGKIRLKSQDFLIVIYAYLSRVDEFITFDKAQKIGYDQVKKNSS